MELNGVMSRKELDNELMYQVTMSITRRMLEKSLIDEEEYKKISTLMQDKYKPVFGGLFSDIHMDLRKGSA